MGIYLKYEPIRKWWIQDLAEERALNVVIVHQAQVTCYTVVGCSYTEEIHNFMMKITWF